MIRGLMVFVLVAQVLISFGQSHRIEGIVTDNTTAKPLAFVNIVSLSSGEGAVTDIDGRFSFLSEVPHHELKVSSIGYKLLLISANEQEYVIIKMQLTTNKLPTFTLTPGVNPANEIIKNAIHQKPFHDPDKLDTYSYNSYNKMVFDIVKFGPSATVYEDHHVMITEFVNERKYIQPGIVNDKVIASRISGMKNPNFTMLATQMQSLSFYPDIIVIFDKQFLNPISKSAHNKYLFQIEDTINYEMDSTYIISFRPKQGKSFEGLKGLVYINFEDFAIANVIAEPLLRTDEMAHIKIEQQYKKRKGDDGKSYWFPYQLNTELDFPYIQTEEGYPIKGTGHTYLTNIKINGEIPSKEMSSIILETDPKAYMQSDTFWSAVRPIALTTEEIKTYAVVDSLGAKHHLDAKMNLFESLILGAIPLSFLNLNLERIYDYNNFEGKRIGFGATTNEKLMPWASIGGYVAHGFKDKAYKFGGSLTFYLSKTRLSSIVVQHKRDVIESGNELMYLKENSFLSNTTMRKYLVKKMDNITKTSVFAKLKIRDITFGIGFNDEVRADNSPYKFLYTSERNVEYWTGRSHFNEAIFAIRLAYNETFTKTRFTYLSSGSKLPVLNFQYIYGTSALGAGFDYSKTELHLDHAYRLNRFGKATVAIRAGSIKGNLPYSKMFVGMASFDQSSIRSANSFETMRYNEFIADKFVNVFWYQELGYLLRKKRAMPLLALVTNFGLGRVAQPESHKNYSIQAYEKGYYESGLVIRHLLKYKYLSLGAEGLYRYGTYAYEDPLANTALKITMDFIL